MITRRGLMRVFGLGTAGLGGVITAQAQAQTPALALADLANMPTRAVPVYVPDQGWFAPTQDAAPTDGVLRIDGANGTQWQRMDADGVLRPQWFTQPEDSGDAALAIQRAFDHAEQYGPLVVDLGSARHACRSRLTLDPTRVTLRGTGATLDFSALPEPPDREITSLANVAIRTGWTRSDGVLVSESEGAETLELPLTLPKTGRVRVTIDIADLNGWQDYPALYAMVEAGDGSWLGGVTPIAPGRYSFEVEGASDTATLKLRADSAVRIDSLTVTDHGQREAVLVRATTASPQYGHHWIEGIKIVGPYGQTALHGVRFQTNATTKSSRLHLRDVSVSGFDEGLVFSHRSYLVRGTSVRIACQVGLHFLGGSQDAGELISLFGSVIDGGRIAIRNTGAEFALFGTSIDFVDQVFVGSGQLALQGCHLELKRPTAADKPPFDVSRGHIALQDGTFLITGEDFASGNQCDHIFALRSTGATATMNGVSVYNLRTQSGALAGGPGRLDITGLRGRRPRHIAPLVQHREDRNLLGPILDLRLADGANGPFLPRIVKSDILRFDPDERHAWLFGAAQSGTELGFFLRARAATTGTIWAQMQAVAGDTRHPIGDSWPLAVGADWTRHANHTGDAHPQSGRDGRVPDGYDNVALYLDLSQVTGDVEISEPFICAI